MCAVPPAGLTKRLAAAIQVVRFKPTSQMTFSPARHCNRQLSVLPVLLFVIACDQTNRPPAAPSPADGIRDSAALFQLITRTDPFPGYTLFPNVEEFTEGRLNGSEAHRPIVRVSINSSALSRAAVSERPRNFRTAPSFSKRLGRGRMHPPCTRSCTRMSAIRSPAMDGYGPSFPRMVRLAILFRTEEQPVRVAINGNKSR
jgi:hypothetical protein